MTDYLRVVEISGTPKLLANDTSLVTDDGTDPCCCGCCSFTKCADSSVLSVLCDDIPPEVDIGEIVKIGGDCYYYNGPTDCIGGEESYAGGSTTYASCSACTCVCADYPDTVYITLAGFTIRGQYILIFLNVTEGSLVDTDYIYEFDRCTTTDACGDYDELLITYNYDYFNDSYELAHQGDCSYLLTFDRGPAIVGEKIDYDDCSATDLWWPFIGDGATFHRYQLRFSFTNLAKSSAGTVTYTLSITEQLRYIGSESVISSRSIGAFFGSQFKPAGTCIKDLAIPTLTHSASGFDEICQYPSFTPHFTDSACSFTIPSYGTATTCPTCTASWGS